MEKKYRLEAREGPGIVFRRQWFSSLDAATSHAAMFHSWAVYNLEGERLIEVELLLEVRLDLRVDAFLLDERAAGHQAHDQRFALLLPDLHGRVHRR